MKTIIIDPGHGGDDPGATGNLASTVIKEKDLNLKIGLLTKSFLIDANYDVYMTRYIDTWVSLSARAKLSNEHHADFFLSIHCDADPEKKGRGFTVYYFSEKGREWAEKLASGLAGLPLHNRGIAFGNFQVLRETKCPAILLECGFMTNGEDLTWLSRTMNQMALARAITNAIKKFL